MCIAPYLKTKFSILELTQAEMLTLSNETAPWKIVLWQKLFEKSPFKISFATF